MRLAIGILTLSGMLLTGFGQANGQAPGAIMRNVPGPSVRWSCLLSTSEGIKNAISGHFDPIPADKPLPARNQNKILTNHIESDSTGFFDRTSQSWVDDILMEFGSVGRAVNANGVTSRYRLDFNFGSSDGKGVARLWSDNTRKKRAVGESRYWRSELAIGFCEFTPKEIPAW